MIEYTVVGFIVLAYSILILLLFYPVIVPVYFSLFQGTISLVYFAIGFSGLVYLNLQSGDLLFLFYIPVLVWLLIYTWLVNRQGHILTGSASILPVSCSGYLCFRFPLPLSCLRRTGKRNGREENYAEKLAVQTDPSSERMMNIAMKYLDNDFLRIIFTGLVIAKAARNLRDSIINENYSGYLNKYETSLYVYDSLDNAVVQ